MKDVRSNIGNKSFVRILNNPLKYCLMIILALIITLSSSCFAQTMDVNCTTYCEDIEIDSGVENICYPTSCDYEEIDVPTACTTTFCATSRNDYGNAVYCTDGNTCLLDPFDTNRFICCPPERACSTCGLCGLCGWMKTGCSNDGNCCKINCGLLA